MAARYTLCSFKTCPWVQRAAIVLQAKRVPYEITYIDRDKRPDWFLAVSPHSKVPVLLIDGKEALFESNAIAEYLDETAALSLNPQAGVILVALHIEGVVEGQLIPRFDLGERVDEDPLALDPCLTPGVRIVLPDEEITPVRIVFAALVAEHHACRHSCQA